MPRKRHKPEAIVAKLRQVDVLTSQGQSVSGAVRSIGVTEVTLTGPHWVVRGECQCMTGLGATAGMASKAGRGDPALRVAGAGTTISGAGTR